MPHIAYRKHVKIKGFGTRVMSCFVFKSIEQMVSRSIRVAHAMSSQKMFRVVVACSNQIVFEELAMWHTCKAKVNIMFEKYRIPRTCFSKRSQATWGM
jgi:hypothetical protein